MALVNLTKSWVGVQRRADEPLGKRDDWYPQSYVTIKLDDGVQQNLSPSGAKSLGKALIAAANVIDPPKPRVKRS
jgi:hypothetical protein